MEIEKGKKKASSRVNKKYSRETSEIITYIFLFLPDVSIRALARRYDITTQTGVPNQSYARQLIIKYLRSVDDRLWRAIDGDSANKEENRASREAMSAYRNRFFPDPERRRKLNMSALVFFQDHLIGRRAEAFQKMYVDNDKMKSVKAQLGDCDKEEVDQAIGEFNKSVPPRKPH